MKFFSFALLMVSSLATSPLMAQQSAALEKGNGYYREAQFDLAERQYRLALRKDSANKAAQHNLANALYRQRKYDAATTTLQQMRQGLVDKELRGRSHFNEGAIYSRQKDLEKSIDAYKHALRNNPTDKEARENLQKALLALKQQQREQQSQQKQKSPSKMNASQANQQLDKLQKKEQEIQERLQKKGGGSAMPKDW
ncbi:MAG TPA: tetratricopeptide repeat protein [Flavisolibacter sp.]